MPLIVQSKRVDACLVELVAHLGGLHDADALLLDWRPDSDGLVSTGTDYELSSFGGELGAEDLILMSTKTAQEVSAGSVQKIKGEVLTTAQDGVTLGVPLHNVDVLASTGSILEFDLELEVEVVFGWTCFLVSLDLPYPQNVIHSSSNAKLSIMVELDMLKCLSVTLKFADLDALMNTIFVYHFPDETLVFAITADKGGVRLLGNLSYAVDMVLMNQAQLAHCVVLDLEVHVEDFALVVLLSLTEF